MQTFFQMFFFLLFLVLTVYFSLLQKLRTRTMPTQRPLTSSVRRIAKAPSRLSNRSASLTRTSQYNQTKNSTAKVNQTINRAAKPFTEKQIAARREKEHQNLVKWQQANKYFREMKARLDLFEHWNQREELRRTKSTGSHLNRLGLSSLNNSLNQLNSNSLNYLNRTDELDMYWSTDQLVNTRKDNQQLAKKVDNQLCSELINELYTMDPRKIPYDIDLDLLRRPEAVNKLKAKVNKQENELNKLKEKCLAAKQELEHRRMTRSNMVNHKRQLEQLYLEYSKNWLSDWNVRFSRLELKCCDEELIFPARKGQLRGKDRLRLRNNLVSEHFDHCKQLLLHVRRLSGHHHKMNKLTGNKLKSNLVKFELNCNQNKRTGGDHLHHQQQQRNLEYNLDHSQTSNEMQSHLMQLLNDDEFRCLSNVMRTTINLLDTYTNLIKRRAGLYAALYEYVFSFNNYCESIVYKF